MTVQDLINLLKIYSPDRKIVFLDPDTEWVMPIKVLDGDHQYRDVVDVDDAVVITSEY